MSPRADKCVKTHNGTWHLFREEFVEPGLLGDELVRKAQNAQRERERADYEAWLPGASGAREVIEFASYLLETVESMLSGEAQ